MTKLLTLSLLLALALAGCSSDDADDPASPNVPEAVEFADYAAAMAAVMPPEFTGAAKAEGNYTMWTEGQYSILGKAIGNAESDEPMSLYRNLNTLQSTISMIEQFAAMGEGEFTGEGPDGFMHTVIITQEDLTQPVAVPAECRGILDVDAMPIEHVIKLEVPDAQIVMHLGYVQSEDAEVVVTWQDEHGEATAFSVAVLDLGTGAVTILGAFYKVTEQETASWIYDISTTGEDNTEFVYNMAWFSSNMGDEGGLSCVNGSGDKDVAFGMRYHQYRAPWIRGQYDTYGPYEQLFGPVGDNPYADLNVDGQYPDNRASLIDEDAMFVYDDMPHAFFASPFGE